MKNRPLISNKIISFIIILFLAVFTLAAYYPVQVVNVKDYGATGNGTTNDWPAFQQAFQAACKSNGQCTATIYVPAGNYLWSSTASGSPFAMTPAARGSGATACIFGLRVHGDGGRQNTTQSQFGAISQITIHDNNASIGWDLMGVGNDSFSDLDVENKSGDTGPVALVAMGKTGTSGNASLETCDSDTHSWNDSSLVSYAGAGTFVFFSYGAENLNVHNTVMDAAGGGNGVDISALNTIGLTSTMTFLTSPVSSTAMTWDNINDNITTHGGVSTPAYGVWFDMGQTGNSVIAQEVFNNYWQINGKEDVGIADGFTGSPSNSNTYTTIHINGRVELTYAGTNTQQFIALGNRIEGADIHVNLGETTTSSSPLIQDTQSVLVSKVYMIGPNAGTCFNSPSDTGSILMATAGCGITQASAMLSGSEGADATAQFANLTISGSGLIGEGTGIFSALPATCIPGQHLYCSNCKSVADAVTMASTCVGSGNGSVAICKGSNTWKCGQ